MDCQRRRRTAAGTHSGFTTTIRIAGPNDKSYPPGSLLVQYEAAYKFKAVGTVLGAGQVTARGTVLLGGNFQALEPENWAITGGRGPYANARGDITEPGGEKLLNIQL